VRGFETDVAVKGSKVNITRKGSKIDVIVRGSGSNISTSIVSTFVARRKMAFKITRGGMVNLGNMKWKKKMNE